MDIIIETDIGHDPDDFFALCYLHAAGANIKGILVNPGDPDQIAIAKLFCKQVGLDIPVGTSDLGRKELSSGSIHHTLLHRYGHSLHAQADCSTKEAIQIAGEFDGFFVIGPATGTAAYAETHEVESKELTMQGGFLPYSMHSPSERLGKFEGKEFIRTFNLLGDPEASGVILAAPWKSARFAGKNVCHTIQFDEPAFRQFAAPRCAASSLFAEAARCYFQKNKAKKFHDPVAAVCMLHPEIGVWIRGKPTPEQGGYTTRPTEGGTQVLADINRPALWKHLQNLT